MRNLKKLAFFLMACMSMHIASAQNPITGKVSDDKGHPVPFASVKIKNSKVGTAADANGAFSISAKPGDILVISGQGVKSTSLTVGTSTQVMAVLTLTRDNLSEVVITALGIKRDKRTLTYSTQEVKGEALVAAKQDNVVNALAGKVPGVQITNSTGMPGASSRIVIRGATSLTGDNQALFVIDGVPMDNSEAGSFDGSLTQGSTANRAIDIDPNIIESMTILKGSAATALYGSSAARGVVLITTKNGTLGKKALLSFSSSYSSDKAILPAFQDKYAQGFNGVYVDGNNGGFSSGSWGPLIDTLKVNGKPVVKHDPRKEFFRTGHTYDNTISVTGSGPKSKYFFSYSYLKDDGIIPTTFLQRHSIFGKFTNQVTDKLSLSFQLNYINTDNHRTNEGNGLGNPLWTVYSAPISWNPFPITNADGSQRLYRAARNNPYWLVANTGFNSAVNRFLPITSLTYTPLSWLTITERLGADIYSDQSDYHEAKGIVGAPSEDGRVLNKIELFRQYNNDLVVEVHSQLTHSLFGTFVLGSNIYSRNDLVNAATGLGLGVDQFYNISNTAKQTTSSTITKYKKLGYYAQANLEYQKLLNLSITARYDGTSALSVGKNYYPYGSAALGFIFSELMSKTSWLSYGKVRVSYSVVGNDNIQPYGASTPYYVASVGNINFPFQGQNGFLLSTLLGNSNLTNEKLKESEVGLDLKFLNNRLSFEGSYYTRKSSELLAPIQIDPATGYSNVNLNVATIQNKGYEFLLTGIPVKTKYFSWEVNLNFSRIRSKVLDLGPGLNLFQFGGFSGGGGIYAFKNEPYGILYGSKYKRDANGQKLVKDDGEPIQDDADGNIGNTNPNWTAGFSNTITYKAIAFSFLFDMKKGGDIFNFDEHYNWFYGTPKATEDRSDRLIQGVRESDGKPNTTPISAQTYFRDISAIDEAVIEDGTYIKLRNVSVSYSITKSKIPGLPFQSISLTVAGRNLWIYKPHFYGSDPEASLQGGGNGQGIVNYMTPTTRSFSIGLRASF